MHNTFEPGESDVYRAPPELWDRTRIWGQLPEVAYSEFMETTEGLTKWLGLFNKVNTHHSRTYKIK